MRPVQKPQIPTGRDRASPPPALSTAWEKAYKSLAVTAAFLLVSAVGMQIAHDGFHAWILFKLGMATEVSMMICFALAVLLAPKR